MDFLTKYKKRAIEVAKGIDFEKFIISNQAVADINFGGGKAYVKLKTIVRENMIEVRTNVANEDMSTDDGQIAILAKSLLSINISGNEMNFPDDEAEKIKLIGNMENNIVIKLIECVDIFNLAIQMILNGELNDMVSEEIKK